MSNKDSILVGVRKSVIGIEDNKEFDDELIPHINSALSKLNQNGVGNFIFVTGEEQTWEQFKNKDQVEGNKYFQMVPLYVNISTKILFDPPPPSSVEYHSKSADELLWRLNVAYEEV